MCSSFTCRGSSPIATPPACTPALLDFDDGTAAAEPHAGLVPVNGLPCSHHVSLVPEASHLHELVQVQLALPVVGLSKCQSQPAPSSSAMRHNKGLTLPQCAGHHAP